MAAGSFCLAPPQRLDYPFYRFLPRLFSVFRLRATRQSSRVLDLLTDGLAKGVRMFDGAADLSEEGMGFGVPVVVSRLRTYLSYRAPVIETSNDGTLIKKVWHLDAVQNIGNHPTDNIWPYLWLETKGLVYKSLPWAQQWLLDKRATGNLTPQVGFVAASSLAKVPVEYRLMDDKVSVSVDLAGLNGLPGRSRVYVLNEQGGRSFPIYRENEQPTVTECDSGWAKVTALTAGFAADKSEKWFNLSARSGAAMYRGREVVEGKLSWSGIEYFINGYSEERFNYQVNIGGSSSVTIGST
jgi:hypothetical protein